MHRSTLLILALVFLWPVGQSAAQSVVQTLQPDDAIQVDSEQCDLQLIRFDSTGLEARCGPAWTPTPAPPTATMIPNTPTATPVPATATATPQGGIGACTHDVTRWHALVEYAADGSIACTYGHTHFDDPRTLDSHFGPLPYGEISYPWMTPNENVEQGKHRFYKWAVYDGPCVAVNSARGLKRFRLQAHADANAGAVTRYHSYFFQGTVCNPSNGLEISDITLGGHMDYGSLYLGAGGKEKYVPLPGDAGDTNVTGGDRRLHGTPGGFRGDWTWYGSHGLGLTVGLLHEDWGPVDPLNLSRQLYYPSSRQNHSWQEVGHLIGHFRPFDVPSSGFADRHGKPVASPCAVGPDCVPYDFGTLNGGQSFQFRTEGQAGGTVIRDYDVLGPDGQSLLRWPN